MLLVPDSSGISRNSSSSSGVQFFFGAARKAQHLTPQLQFNPHSAEGILTRQALRGMAPCPIGERGRGEPQPRFTAQSIAATPLATPLTTRPTRAGLAGATATRDEEHRSRVPVLPPDMIRATGRVENNKKNKTKFQVLFVSQFFGVPGRAQSRVRLYRLSA